MKKPLRFVVSNQRGGVGKTTTTLAMAKILAEGGMRVLVTDTDSQGSVSSALRLKPKYSLKNFAGDRMRLEECVVSAAPGIDVLCSNRETMLLEAVLLGQIAREEALARLFTGADEQYDAHLIDVSPSITLLQTCAMVYCRRVLIPVDMDTLSFQGALASIEAARSLNKFMHLNPPDEICVVGILPTKVDRRLGMTAAILDGLEGLCKDASIPLLPAIRTDQTTVKAYRMGKFLTDYDPKSKAAEDYRITTQALLEAMEAVGR